ncbi:hypothetical protein ACNKU7_01865 [Microbulbifer sp. SA54]|uniref:hypothetical protein n=1 Tax=Microbulbifer sp. SA54 TaxID=3401577 RepID=UPI003AADFD01
MGEVMDAVQQIEFEIEIDYAPAWECDAKFSADTETNSVSIDASGNIRVKENTAPVELVFKLKSGFLEGYKFVVGDANIPDSFQPSGDNGTEFYNQKTEDDHRTLKVTDKDDNQNLYTYSLVAYKLDDHGNVVSQVTLDPTIKNREL